MSSLYILLLLIIPILCSAKHNQIQIVMRIPPNKPHFFKPILPGFKNGLKIPVSFSKYLCGERSKCMLLRRGARKWRVKISGQSLEEGWKRFAVENNLEVGDFVVFKHEGNMVFDVMVFDPSHCEREYPWIRDVRNDEPEEKETPSHKKFKSAGLRRSKARSRLSAKSAISIDSEGNSEEDNVSISTSRKVSSHDDNDEEPDKPSFVSSIKPYCIEGSVLNVPLRFARANNLRNRSCEAILRNPEQNSWQVELVPRASHVCITRGWRAFFKANGLKLGDTFKIELVENGDIPIFNFLPCSTSNNYKTRIRGRARPDQPQPFSTAMETRGKHLGQKLEAASSSESDCHGYFVSTIMPYSIKKSVLHLPLKFARSTGLIKLNGEMVLRDERQRQWPVKLERKGTHFLISRGWSKFRASNGLKAGDTYKFELIKKGQRPLANFYCNFSEEDIPTLN